MTFWMMMISFVPKLVPDRFPDVNQSLEKLIGAEDRLPLPANQSRENVIWLSVPDVTMTMINIITKAMVGKFLKLNFTLNSYILRGCKANLGAKIQLIQILSDLNFRAKN